MEPDFATIAEVAPAIAAGEISPVALTQAVLARISDHNGTLNAFMTVTAEAALAQAHAAEAEIAAGRWCGPLHGIPIAIKDLFATRGVRTTAGSLLFDDWVPEFDAAVVERLRAAGAVIVGKTGMHELAYGSTSINPHYGAIRNPWNTACHPGGSSGGSAAAVAAGMAFAALGSDTGCSIRQPAACCGIVGFKPTFGRISKYGAIPLAWSLDHMGPLTRCVADAAILYQALAGYDPRDASATDEPVGEPLAGLEEGIAGCRIVCPRAFFFDQCEPEIVAAVETAARQLAAAGARVEEMDLPMIPEAHLTGNMTIMAEAAAYHDENLRTHPEKFSDEVRALVELGHGLSAVEYLQAQRLRRRITREILEALSPYDAILTPSAPVPATPIDNSPPHHGPLRFRNTIPFNLTGLPAISVPCGFTGGGLPIGLQIVGKPYDEAMVLRIAHTYERATDWHTRHPTL